MAIPVLLKRDVIATGEQLIDGICAGIDSDGALLLKHLKDFSELLNRHPRNKPVKAAFINKSSPIIYCDEFVIVLV